MSSQSKQPKFLDRLLPDMHKLHDEDFFDTPPKNEAEYSAFRQRLVEDAAAWKVLRNTNKPFQAEVVGRWRLCDLQCLHPEGPDCRSVPATVRRDAFLREDSKFILDMDHPVQTGPDKMSQVWRGSIRILNAEDGGYDLLVSPVIIKIFQQSLFHPPEEFSNPHGINYGYWLPSALRARREAWAFSCMAEMQGREIPWSYGVYKVMLPHGEPAFVHVMEFILEPAPKVRDLRGTSAHEVCKLVDAMASAVHKMTDCGVYHNDISRSNMIIQQGETYPVVIIDFSSSHPLLDEETNSSHAFHAVVDIFTRMGVRYSAMHEWVKDAIRRDTPFGRLIATHMDSMPTWFEDQARFSLYA